MPGTQEIARQDRRQIDAEVVDIGARMELAASEASFRSRYIVTSPAEVPRRPTKPNVAAILVAGALGAFVLAVAAAVGTDLISRRVVDSWQLERQLGIPVLVRLNHP